MDTDKELLEFTSFISLSSLPIDNCDISGSYLMGNGWARKASTYTKGEHLITYDGCNWYLNGKRIFTINEIP